MIKAILALKSFRHNHSNLQHMPIPSPTTFNRKHTILSNVLISAFIFFRFIQAILIRRRKSKQSAHVNQNLKAKVLSRVAVWLMCVQWLWNSMFGKVNGGLCIISLVLMILL
ncbi:hypothetical protein M438DRAFT_349215 [Aureobasidium pullulans EXF-150]|uniref:Transmembrane protein n=1 Tax=Aureobasidium pullulans EXF-150 TaxID=1043002 RepID=A0A074XZ29_AURPU|nr:uncharacterized protein M438DRAFT_349215 [Aureobasidium pullulans EXF-150]KEQ79946.1 hypothetical protein M438DRAFT_349215 [Aureobasidium pullulans EXF-150]